MRRSAQQEVQYTYGPEIALGDLPAGVPHKLLTERPHLLIGPGIRARLLEHRVAYLQFPPVTLITVDTHRMIAVADLLERLHRDKPQRKIRLLEHKHAPRIIELVNRRAHFEATGELIMRGRNLFPFPTYTAVLEHSMEPNEKEWRLESVNSSVNALKRDDRTFFIAD